LYNIPKPPSISPQDLYVYIARACGVDPKATYLISDLDGCSVDVSSLMPGEKYILYILESSNSSQYSACIKNLLQSVSPLTHSEAQEAIQLMQSGSNMLKHTRNGLPHIRLFQLTSDLTRLLWFTDNPDSSKSSVDLREVSRISTGQTSETFRRYRIPMLRHLSFTIYYKDKDLNITCKDEKEFDLWVLGCKALLYHYRNLKISKQELLNHSRRFLENLKEKKVAESSVIFDNPTSITLDECIVRKPLTITQLREKIIKARYRHNLLLNLARDLPQRTGVEHLSSTANHKLAYGGDYCGLVLNEEEEEVYATHEHRLAYLLEANESALVSLENEYEAFMKSGSNSHPKSLENKAWALDIDIENASDIVKRISSGARLSWRKRMRNWFKVKLSI
jgi:hypothetical protein